MTPPTFTLHPARRALCATAVLAVVFLALPALAAAASPAWRLVDQAVPAAVPAGGNGFFTLQVQNIGNQSSDGSPVIVTDHLPPGLTATAAYGLEYSTHGNLTSRQEGNWNCSGAGTPTVTCVNNPEVVFHFPVDRGLKAFQPTFYNGWGLNNAGCSAAGAIECFSQEGGGNLPETPEQEAFRTMPLPIAIAYTLAPGATGLLSDDATLAGGGAPAPAGDHSTVEVSASAPPFGAQNARVYAINADGSPDTQAGSHPYAVTAVLKLNGGEESEKNGAGALRSVHAELPSGLIGNPMAYPRCPQQLFEESREWGESACPIDTQVGALTILFIGQEFSNVPIYSIDPSHGEAALFAGAVKNFLVHINVHVSSGPGHRITLDGTDIPYGLPISFADVTFWGTPSDPSHDRLRGLNAPKSSDAPLKPFLTLPTQCGVTMPFSFSFTRWERGYGGEPLPEDGPVSVGPIGTELGDELGNPVTLSGCSKLEYTPSIEARSTSTSADSPTGFEGDYKTPAAAHEEHPEQLAEGELKNMELTLPAGVTVNPSSANGLGVCSEAQIALGAAGAGECPESSRVATLQAQTPLLDHPMPGAVYLATQDQNPFHTLLAAYVVINDPISGTVIKLPAELKANPETGQLTARLPETPQYPLSDVKIKFFEDLATPQSCGTFTTTSDLTPWSTPETPDATPSSSFAITTGAGGAACPGTLPFAPAFSGGTASNQAGAFSPLELSITRRDGEQHISGLTLQLPEGLAAVLKGVAECPEPQAAKGECGPESLIGEASASAGVGPHPYVLHGGRVYLTGPYNGGSFGDVVVIPAVAGPFNLGNVVNRDSIRINPVTAQVSIVADPLPQMVNNTEGRKSGIPTDVRQIEVSINRPNFTFNPSSCAPMSMTGELTGAQGTVAAVSSRYQAAGCAALKFAPQFTATTQGNGTTKGHGASLDVKIGYPQPFTSYANIAKVDTSLPLALSSRLTTLQKACTEAQFAADPANCPPASDVGTATATTPLLPNPMIGPAYLVSHGGKAFPDLVVILQGNNVTIDLTGNTDIKGGITYSKFETVPDAPVSSFELNLPEKENALLGAVKNLCDTNLEMPTEMTGQNGAFFKQSNRITVTGCSGSLSVVSSHVNKKTLKLSVYAPAAGKVTASGKGVSSGSKTYSGQEALTFTLKEKKAGKLKTKIKLTFTPSKGSKQSKSLSVKFKK
jgi:uncharacterized repeat protein (TIGR01451 family)